MTHDEERWTDHACTFDEIELSEADEDVEGNLKAGMKVLIPCPECGETPRDHMEFMDARDQELEDALLAYKPHLILYHWSPRARRNQIIRYGFRPRMRPTIGTDITVTYGAPCVCFADSPSWAWALSGEQRHAPKGEWDLWQTTVDRLTDPIVLASDTRMSGLYEVRTEHRVYKRDLWWVGSRVKR